MKITWYGHASFLITTAKGIKIITDPYEPGAFGGELQYGPISDEADIVTVSHDHADHNYVQGLPGKPQVIKGAGRHEIKGVVVEGFSAFHDASQGSQRGANIIFTFLTDDIRVCHLGDLGHVLSDNDIKNIGQIDVLMVPVGGAFTIGAKEASTVVGQLRPKLIFPMHLKTAKCNIPIEPVDTFLQGKKDVQRLDESSFIFTKEDLKTGLGIVVLQPAL
ncbi:MAG: MBL fold metallo-hydrolase [Deltaproteobacteria bacterium]|nr:MBL fold metallo-hydrolase [Deltaproteobacteria bacterium]